VLAKIAYAGGDTKSFAKGGQQLARLAELTITGRHVGRLTTLLGEELVQARDQEVAAYRRRELTPQVGNVPQAVAVETDGGRVHTRVPDHGPGVHEPHWREDKIGFLATLEGQEHASDPHAEVPCCYLDQKHVCQLVQEIHGMGGASPENAENAEKARETTCAAERDNAVPELAATEEKTARKPRWQPKRLVRTVVATLQDVHAFGPMVAAEAQRRNFFAAARAAFVGDGQASNWTLQRTWFPEFIAIADFVHALTYIYESARASTTGSDEFWPTYVRWLTALWEGRVAEVSADLAALVEPLRAQRDPSSQDQQRLTALEKGLTYLQNNASRMDYPRYRRLGLPIVSALVESLIKEMNWRVKGSEKFWNDPAGAEPILQVRAALLSDDDRLARHLQNRPGNAYRRQRTQAA